MPDKHVLVAAPKGPLFSEGDRQEVLTNLHNTQESQRRITLLQEFWIQSKKICGGTNHTKQIHNADVLFLELPIAL